MTDVIIKSYMVAGDLSDGYDFEYDYKHISEAKKQYNDTVNRMLYGFSSVTYVALYEIAENRTQHTQTETILARYEV